MDALTPAHIRPRDARPRRNRPWSQADLEQGWRRVLETGVVTSNDFSPAGRDYLAITNYSVANILPGRHVILFVPAGWPLDGGPPEDDVTRPAPDSLLTRRELAVLALAANGLDGPVIAEAPVLSRATVRTHFVHITRSSRSASAPPPSQGRCGQAFQVVGSRVPFRGAASAHGPRPGAHRL